MSGLADMGVPGWLPVAAQRNLQLEAVADARAEREAEAERERDREQRHERAVSLARSQAEQRGEFLSPLDVARGVGVGRTFGEVFAAAIAECDMADAREHGRQAREARGGPAHAFVDEPAVGRSGWPESSYEVDRLVRQAMDSRSWMAAYQARLASRRGRYAEHAEAKRQQAAERHHDADLRRDRPTSTLTAYTEISR